MAHGGKLRPPLFHHLLNPLPPPPSLLTTPLRQGCGPWMGIVLPLAPSFHWGREGARVGHLSQQLIPAHFLHPNKLSQTAV
jgi:hypothetical protein